MTKSLLVALTALCLSGTAPAANECDQFTGCRAKTCNLEVQIRAAQQANNDAREKGLNTALNKVLEHCNDGDLKEGIEDDIRESESELREYQQELEEKTAKLRGKIEEKQSEIKALQSKLNTMTP